MKFRTAVIAGLLALAVIAWADGTYTIQRAVKAGDVDRYRTVIQISSERGGGAPLKFDVVMATSDTIREVKPDGSYVVVTSVESGNMVFGGREQPLPGAGQSYTFTHDKSGRITKSEGPMDSLIGQMIALTRLPLGSDEPLKIGEPKRYEAAYADGRNQKATGTITLAGIEKSGADVPVETLRIKVVADVTGLGAQNDQKAHIEAVALIDPRTGKAHREEGVATSAALGPIHNARLSFKVTRER